MIQDDITYFDASRRQDDRLHQSCPPASLLGFCSDLEQIPHKFLQSTMDQGSPVNPKLPLLDQTAQNLGSDSGERLVFYERTCFGYFLTWTCFLQVWQRLALPQRRLRRPSYSLPLGYLAWWGHPSVPQFSVFPTRPFLWFWLGRLSTC